MEKKEVDDSQLNPGHPDNKPDAVAARIAQARRSAQQAQAQAEAKEETKDDRDREDRLNEQVQGAMDAGFGTAQADFGMPLPGERAPMRRGEGGGSAVRSLPRPPFVQNAVRGQGDLPDSKDTGGGKSVYPPR